MLRELDRLVRDLRRQLASRADDEGANVGLRESIHRAGESNLAIRCRVFCDLLGMRTQGVQPRLDCRNEESKCFTSTSARLHQQVARASRFFPLIGKLDEPREKREDGRLDGAHVVEAEGVACESTERTRRNSAFKCLKLGLVGIGYGLLSAVLS